MDGPIPEKLYALLQPGEHVLWHGKPRDDFRGPWYAWIFGFVIGPLFIKLGWFVIGLPMNSDKKGPFGALLFIWFWGGAVIAIGFGFVFHQFLDRLKRSWTLYAVTDRRVIALEPTPWPWVMSIELGRLLSTRVVFETDDGAGSLQFIASGWSRINGRHNDHPEFDRIEGPYDVQTIVASARAAVPAKELEPLGWTGAMAEPAPPWMAGLAAACGFLAAALYPEFIGSDLLSLSKKGWGAIFSTLFYGEHATGVLGFAAAPLAMAYVLRRALNYWKEGAPVRKGDAWTMAALALAGLAILLWENAGGRTSGYAVLGAVALLLTSRKFTLRA